MKMPYWRQVGEAAGEGGFQKEVQLGHPAEGEEVCYGTNITLSVSWGLGQSVLVLSLRMWALLGSSSTLPDPFCSSVTHAALTSPYGQGFATGGQEWASSQCVLRYYP